MKVEHDQAGLSLVRPYGPAFAWLGWLAPMPYWGVTGQSLDPVEYSWSAWLETAHQPTHWQAEGPGVTLAHSPLLTVELTLSFHFPSTLA